MGKLLTENIVSEDEALDAISELSNRFGLSVRVFNTDSIKAHAQNIYFDVKKTQIPDDELERVIREVRNSEEWMELDARGESDGEEAIFDATLRALNLEHF